MQGDFYESKLNLPNIILNMVSLVTTCKYGEMMKSSKSKELVYGQAACL